MTLTPNAASLICCNKEVIQTHTPRQGFSTTHRIGVLSYTRGGSSEDIRRIEFGIHRIRLTRIDHEEDFVVPEHPRHQSTKRMTTRRPPFLLPHLLEGICDVKCADLLVVLELEKLVSSVTGHVHEDVRPIIREKPL